MIRLSVAAIALAIAAAVYHLASDGSVDEAELVLLAFATGCLFGPILWLEFMGMPAEKPKADPKITRIR